jgi:hypothetical protein
MLQKEESKKKRHQKRIRLQNGTRESIVKRAIEKFQVKGKFDVPKQTIHNRIQKNRLEVQQSGVQSPVLFVEVVLVSFIINAWALNCPISVGGTVSLMNNLVEGTEHEAKLIKWKKDRGLLDSDPSAPLLGDGWLRGFQRRNPTLKAKYGRRYPRNRQEHCNDTTFTKMYDQTEVLITKSGNARPFETPVHMDIEGNVVENESLAFGRPVTLDIHRKTNCFLGDEVGDNTHGKDDGNNGGEKAMVPEGEVPKIVTSTKNSHFTLFPINDFTGDLRFCTVIFKGDKLNPLWALGFDAFAPLNENDELQNFGPGKRYPGLVLIKKDGPEIPVLYSASPNASMDSNILKQTMQRMDELGITERGFNEDGTPFYPFMLIDAHISRIGEDYLRYVNDEENKWMSGVGAPYGTDIWQFHDDERENGTYKCQLAMAKADLILKKRAHGLDPEIEPFEIVILLQQAIPNSFMREEYGRKALVLRGWCPYNRNALDHPQILASAPQNIQTERTRVLNSRGADCSIAQFIPPQQQNLLECGSGELAGGVTASEELLEVIESLNYGGDCLQYHGHRPKCKDERSREEKSFGGEWWPPHFGRAQEETCGGKEVDRRYCLWHWGRASWSRGTPRGHQSQ